MSDCSAAGLLASLAPHLPVHGITRVGLLTGLDVLGIPVAFAARPNSRALSVTQGKSLCADEARLGAVMEALEQAFAERSEELTVCRATRAEIARLGRAADPSDFRRAARPSGADAQIAWARATSLISGAVLFVPLELVGLDLRKDGRPDVAVNPISGIGLAAGPCWEAAATHALLEVIEHNATAALGMFGFLDGLARPVRWEENDDPALDDIGARIARAGFSYQLYDLSSPSGLPVIAALLECPDPVRGWTRFAGFACRFSPEHAAEAALLEAVQSRLTVISGARDDLNPAAYLGHPQKHLPEIPKGEFLRALPRPHAHLRDAPPHQRLAQALKCAVGLGARDVLAAAVGEIPGLVSVVRVLASDLEAPGFNTVTVLGRRTLQAMLAAAEAAR
jgi:ribosomal protein S12 methylthiotransferase accessory factor